MEQYYPCSSLRKNDFEHRCLCLAKADFLVKVKIKTSSCMQGLLKVFHLEVLFNKKFNFEVIIDPHAAGGNIQRDLMCPSAGFPIGSILHDLRVISQPGKWHGYSPLTFFRFRQFYLHSFVWVHGGVCTVLCSLGICNLGNHQSQVRTVPSPKSLELPSYMSAHPPPSPWSLPSPLQPPVFFFTLYNFFILRMPYKWNHTVYNLWD